MYDRFNIGQYVIWIYFLFIATACTDSSQGIPASLDLTSSLQYIGNPYRTKYPDGEMVYSRNIWDMQYFDGKIFLGAGNSSNRGPSRNSGPLPLIVFNPDKKRFETETIVEDEQIDQYKIIDGALYLPGHDATGSWQWGNFYVRQSGGRWKMYRNVPNALHLYDMVRFDGWLMAGIGLDEGAAVGMTKDMGEHWNIQKLGRSRVYAFLPLDGKLFAFKKFKWTGKAYFSAAQYLSDGTFSARFDLTMERVFPDTAFVRTYAKVVRVLPLKKQTLYIGAYKYNDHQSLPFGLYIASLKENRFKAQRIMLGKGVKPRDILLRGENIYVLTEEKKAEGSTIGVWKSSTGHLSVWREIFHFDYPTFARSFEKRGSYFYFGMGCDINMKQWRDREMPDQTGDILQLNYEEQ